MTYGATSTIAGGGLAATGFAFGSWFVGAITLLLLGFCCLQLVRRGPAERP